MNIGSKTYDIAAGSAIFRMTTFALDVNAQDQFSMPLISPSINGEIDGFLLHNGSKSGNFSNIVPIDWNGTIVTSDLFIVTGTTLVKTVSAAPEPATWGLMILGFGMVGAALRYRRRSTSVAYA